MVWFGGCSGDDVDDLMEVLTDVESAFKKKI